MKWPYQSLELATVCDVEYHIFSRMAYKRVKQILKAQQSKGQGGFCSSVGVDAAFAVFENVCSKSTEWSVPMWCASLDLRNAFDRIDPNALFDTMKVQGVPHGDFKFVASLYHDRIVVLFAHSMVEQSRTEKTQCFSIKMFQENPQHPELLCEQDLKQDCVRAKRPPRNFQHFGLSPMRSCWKDCSSALHWRQEALRVFWSYKLQPMWSGVLILTRPCFPTWNNGESWRDLLFRTVPIERLCATPMRHWREALKRNACIMTRSGWHKDDNFLAHCFFSCWPDNFFRKYLWFSPSCDILIILPPITRNPWYELLHEWNARVRVARYVQEAGVLTWSQRSLQQYCFFFKLAFVFVHSRFIWLSMGIKNITNVAFRRGNLLPLEGAANNCYESTKLVQI